MKHKTHRYKNFNPFYHPKWRCTFWEITVTFVASEQTPVQTGVEKSIQESVTHPTTKEILDVDAMEEDETPAELGRIEEEVQTKIKGIENDIT